MCRVRPPRKRGAPASFRYFPNWLQGLVKLVKPEESGPPHLGLYSSATIVFFFQQGTRVSARGRGVNERVIPRV
jgi:hypothetical protein